jgi:hypothetical protein
MTLRQPAVLALPLLAGACASSRYEPPLPTLPSPQRLPAPPAAGIEPPDTLPDLPPEDPVRAASGALTKGLVKPRREWFKGVAYAPPYHPNHAYLVYIPEGGKTSFQFGRREIPQVATCQDGGVILSTAWTQTGGGATESWVLDVKAKMRAPRQTCSITTSRGVYVVVVQTTASTHTMIVRWSDPYGFLAPDNALPSAPVCAGTDINYRMTGDPGAFGLTPGGVSNDGAHTCIRFPPSAAFDLPAAWLVEGDRERPASPATINGAYLIDGVPPIIELRTDTATLRIERLERKAP